MIEAREAIHEHHQEILTTLTQRVEAITAGRPDADPTALVTFLRRELVPHALGEEHSLYPALDDLLKTHGKPTATMRIDHEYIAGYIDWIDEIVEEIKTAEPRELPALRSLLERLCVQLEALLQVHMAKEERVYLPLFEEYLPPEEQQRILDAMHSEYTDAPPIQSGHVLEAMHVVPDRG